VIIHTCPTHGAFVSPSCPDCDFTPPKATKAAKGKRKAKTAEKAVYEAFPPHGAKAEKVRVSSKAKNLQGEWVVCERWGLKLGRSVILEAQHEETIDYQLGRRI
jgi:hypothetical protein